MSDLTSINDTNYNQLPEDVKQDLKEYAHAT